MTQGRRNFGRWRAVTLTAVYLAMGLHIAHWRIAGKTLAPLELNELMVTLELGIVTAGFLFMATVVLATLVFGRFFCSWACHILALQDLCAWLMQRVHIRPKPVHSRLLPFLPTVAMSYMFLWPQAGRLARGEGLPKLHVQAHADPWASFVTDDFWRNLPGPWITTITFLVCGFAIVYFLGSRSFCNNAGPYGAIFGLADRFAPGRLVVEGDCTSCGRCTAVCQSGVVVHEELQRFGKVADLACLKDLDCVAACPTGGLRFGFTTPALFSSWKSKGRARRKFHFSRGEEVQLALVVIASILVFRGLYSSVPFLLSLAIATLLAYGSVLCVRLLRGDDVSLRGRSLRTAGRLTAHGRRFVPAAIVVTLFVGHSAFIRYHEVLGERAFASLRQALGARDKETFTRVLPEALSHLSACARWGLWRPLDLHRGLAALYPYSATPERAEPHLAHLVAVDPGDHGARIRLARTLIETGRIAEAAEHVERLYATPDLQGGERTGAARACLALAERYEARSAGDVASLWRTRAERLGDPTRP